VQYGHVAFIWGGSVDLIARFSDDGYLVSLVREFSGHEIRLAETVGTDSAGYEISTLGDAP